MLKKALDRTQKVLAKAVSERAAWLEQRPIGVVIHTGDGVARIRGLSRVKSGELLHFESGERALALDLEADSIDGLMLDRAPTLAAGDRVFSTGQVLHVPVGAALIGRVVDAIGRPMDGGGEIAADASYPVERDAVAIMQRAPVTVPLQTGIKAVDALVPIGRGQRELILGDRQTGKSTLAVDTIINQRDEGVVCVYVSIGQRHTATAQVIADLQAHGAMEYTIVLAAGGDDPAGLRYIAPYAATSMAEYLMEQGRDVLIVYDDLTKHAESYRELSLILRRPPAREAYPGDIFYAHARLLERSTRLIPDLGGGSMTALPIAETQAEDMSAYIPTNLISITDGQIYLSADLFQKGIRPAVDVGKSVSRVGGRSQIAAYRGVASQLKLAYSQFEELEFFSRLGTRLDAVSAQIIRRGQRIREVLKQPPVRPMTAEEQIAVLTMLNDGVFDRVEPHQVARVEAAILERLKKDEGEPLARIAAAEGMDDAARSVLETIAEEVIRSLSADRGADGRSHSSARQKSTDSAGVST